MAKDKGDAVRDALGHAVREAVKNVGDASPKPKAKRNGGGPLSGARGLAAGAGLAAAAPLAKKGVDAIRAERRPSMPSMPSPGSAAGGIASKAGERVGSNLKDVVSSKVDEAGGAGGLVKEAASGLLPGGGGDSGGKGGMAGVGKGRRMPVQQSVDVAVPLETAYNQFTQFEDWPEFMHRVTRVTQEDDCTIRSPRRSGARRRSSRPRSRRSGPTSGSSGRSSQGITHSGVVTFHELAPNLTRIEVNLDVDPGSLIEKAARGMRHVKRAVRADLARYKAFIEMQELETGAWRGVIEDGELVEPHDDEYDEERDYSDVDDLKEEAEAMSGDDEDDDDGTTSHDEPVAAEDLPRDRTGRFKKGAGARPREGGRLELAQLVALDLGRAAARATARPRAARSPRAVRRRSRPRARRRRAKRKSTGTTRSRGASNGSGSSTKRSTSSSSRRRSSGSSRS